jgi:hypothetical protein
VRVFIDPLAWLYRAEKSDLKFCSTPACSAKRSRLVFQNC